MIWRSRRIWVRSLKISNCFNFEGGDTAGKNAFSIWREGRATMMRLGCESLGQKRAMREPDEFILP
jgi:hypothetical protein